MSGIWLDSLAGRHLLTYVLIRLPSPNVWRPADSFAESKLEAEALLYRLHLHSVSYGFVKLEKRIS